MYTTVPVNENCIKLFLFDPELPCLCFSSSKISDQFFICLFLSGNIQIHLSHSHGFPEFEKPKKWRLIRSIYRPNSWNKIPTQKLCHTWNKNGDRIKGLKLRRFGKLNFTYRGKLRCHSRRAAVTSSTAAIAAILLLLKYMLLLVKSSH